MVQLIKHFDGMLFASLFVNIFYAATYPYIHKEVMLVATDSYIAINQIVNCLSIIVFSFVWNKFSDRIFKFYVVFCIAEAVLGIGTTAFAICTNHILAYYLLDTFVFALITRNIICGGVKLKAMRYKTEKEREQFDNNDNLMSSLGFLGGSIIALFLKLDFTTMLCIATFGNMIDNIIYIAIYYKEKGDKQWVIR